MKDLTTAKLNTVVYVFAGQNKQLIVSNENYQPKVGDYNEIGIIDKIEETDLNISNCVLSEKDGQENEVIDIK